MIKDRVLQFNEIIEKKLLLGKSIQSILDKTDIDCKCFIEADNDYSLLFNVKITMVGVCTVISKLSTALLTRATKIEDLAMFSVQTFMLGAKKLERDRLRKINKFLKENSDD